MNERTKALHELRQKALKAARDITDQAQADGRESLSAEEEVSYQRHMDDWDRYEAAIKRETELGEREAQAEEARKRYTDAAPEQRQEVDEFLNQLTAAVQLGRNDSMSWTLPESRYVQKGMNGRLFYGQTEKHGVVRPEVRTDYPYTSTDAATTYSSYTVPTLVANSIEEQAYAYSAVLQAGANIIVTEGINAMYVPKVTTDPTINLTAENTAPTDSSYAVIGRTTLNGYRCDAFVVVTEEDIASSGADMMAFISSNLAGAVAAKIASYLAVGTGSSQPNGLFVAATTGATAASATTFTGDEVISTYQSVSAQYRPGLRAAISQSGETRLSQLKNAEGNYLWRQGLAAGTPDTLLGVPLFVDPQGPALTTGKKPLVFYSPRNFHVRMCMGGRTDYAVSTEAQFTKWNRVVRIARWIDCDAGDSGGCKSLTLA